MIYTDGKSLASPNPQALRYFCSKRLPQMTPPPHGEYQTRIASRLVAKAVLKGAKRVSQEALQTMVSEAKERGAVAPLNAETTKKLLTVMSVQSPHGLSA